MRPKIRNATGTFAWMSRGELRWQELPAYPSCPLEKKKIHSTRASARPEHDVGNDCGTHGLAKASLRRLTMDSQGVYMIRESKTREAV